MPKKVRGNPGKLVPLNKRTKREQSEIAKMGGEASGAKRRENRELKEIAKQQLEVIVRGDVTAKEVAVARAISIACKGKLDRDALNALNLIAKIIGEHPDKPSEVDKEKELTTVFSIIAEAFTDG